MESKEERELWEQAIRFPSLDKADGISPWYPNLFDTWAAEYQRDVQAVHAARFLLHRWNPSCEWECGPFQVREALRDWDRNHRRAFLESVTQDSIF